MNRRSLNSDIWLKLGAFGSLIPFDIGYLLRVWNVPDARAGATVEML